MHIYHHIHKFLSTELITSSSLLFLENDLSIPQSKAMPFTYASDPSCLFKNILLAGFPLSSKCSTFSFLCNNLQEHVNHLFHLAWTISWFHILLSQYIFCSYLHKIHKKKNLWISCIRHIPIQGHLLSLFFMSDKFLLLTMVHFHLKKKIIIEETKLIFCKIYIFLPS